MRVEEGVDGSGTQAASRTRGRALALLVALAVIATLAGGWLVDGLATAPGASPSAGTQRRQVGLATVTLVLSPAPLRTGRPETFILRLTDATGAAVVGAQARCALSMPAMAMGLPGETATPTNQPGEYVCGPHALAEGHWSLDVALILPDGASGRTTFSLNVA
ncbi:MAG: hypothetical protein KGO05_16255 [Chloroflexota bacterium]|nr:hypothetical protein [Chloroflexota bacterium]